VKGFKEASLANCLGKSLMMKAKARKVRKRVMWVVEVSQRMLKNLTAAALPFHDGENGKLAFVFP